MRLTKQSIKQMDDRANLALVPLMTARERNELANRIEAQSHKPISRLDEEPDATRCQFCGKEFVPTQRGGIPQRYCKPSHRTRANEQRRIREAIQAARGGA